jgi:hypothetical protein
MKKQLINLVVGASFISIASSAFAQRAQQADQFVDSVGINTHITYTNTAYASQWGTVLTYLKDLHIHHVRDGFYPWAEGNAYYTKHQQLHALGIDCDYVTSPTAVPTPEQVELVKNNAGDMGYLEAPNEMDDQKGADWANVLHNDLPTLYASGSANHVPVFGPSLVKQASYSTLGDVSAYMDYNNLHVYFGGRNPGTAGWGNGDAQRHYYGSTPWWMDNAQIDGPEVPSVVTETGYLAQTEVTPYTLPQNIEAKYIQRSMLEMFNAGVKKSYFYELLDEVSSPGYGLVDSNMKPKLAFLAVRNLMMLLEDPGTSFQPGAVTYSLTGAASDVHQLLLQKRDGTFYLVMWIEASGYDEATNTVTAVPSQKVTLNLTDATVSKTVAFNDQGTSKTTAGNNQTSLALTLNDTVTVVEITAK